MHKLFYILCFSLYCAHLCFGQQVLQIKSLPEDTPENSSYFLAGNINNWQPGDSNFLFKGDHSSGYFLELKYYLDSVEFKITRSSWKSVEANEEGKFRPNRKIASSSNDTIKISIAGWEDLAGNNLVKTTACDRVQLWKDSMYMPQLDRYRDIWVYLPSDYEDSEKRYKVLYMHDGQNVFDDVTAFAGEWQVDETLIKLEEEGYESAIVVAIENQGDKRMEEYSPYANMFYGGGEGDEYLDFIVHTLKPAVDSSFRTLSGPENTGIMGSSMGGLISHYSGLKHPEVFGSAAVFSPSYWFSSELYDFTEEVELVETSKFYMLAGQLEPNVAASMKKMEEIFVKKQIDPDHLKVIISEDGEHSEWFWAREFREAFIWMFELE